MPCVNPKTIMTKMKEIRFTIPYAPTDRSPPYFLRLLLMRMTMTQRAEFSKNGDIPTDMMSLIILKSMTKSFLLKRINSSFLEKFSTDIREEWFVPL